MTRIEELQALLAKDPNDERARKKLEAELAKAGAVSAPEPDAGAVSEPDPKPKRKAKK